MQWTRRLGSQQVHDLSGEYDLCLPPPPGMAPPSPPRMRALPHHPHLPSSDNLRVTTLGDKRFRMQLEDAMSFGQPLLLENVEEEIDPVLDPYAALGL